MPTRLELIEQVGPFAQALTKWGERCCVERFGEVSFARLHLLRALYVGGPQIMSGLSEQLGVTPRSVTSLVDGLEKDGMVRRKPHPTDRRATIVEFAGPAREKTEQMMQELAEHVGAIFDELSEEEVTQLMSITGKLSNRLSREMAPK